MRHLPLPRRQPREVYAACISTTTRDLGLRTRYEAAADLIVAASERFAVHAARADTHTLDPKTFQPENSGLGGPLEVTTSELKEKLYQDRMVGGPGRPIYDEIKLSAPYGVCPLCGVRPVSTLDHYLPRAHFPALAVTPLNLLPACGDCNKTKSDKAPTIAEQQTFHPYFDNIDDTTWLVARVEPGPPVTVQFSVEQSAAWDATLAARVSYHFTILALAEIYAFHANSTIRGMSIQLGQLLRGGGEDLVREHLDGLAASHRSEDRNGWQAAMYRALADSPWYCGGGF